MNQKLLLIDDDRDLCQMLTEYLADYEYFVESVHDGKQGLQSALSHSWSLVLVDVMLPGMDGFELVRRLRSKSTVPILLLTARGDEVNRIVGLELGADDYLPKPFNVRELVARIRAILRRQGRLAAPEPSREQIRVGKIILDTIEREASYDSKPLELTDVELSLLECLMRFAGSTVGRDRLSPGALGRKFNPFDRSLDMHISRLRKKLETAGLPVENLRTMRGEGYRLSARAGD